MNSSAGKATYKSGDVDVTGFFCHPDGNGPYPALLMLHGKSGQPKTPPPETAWLAEKGYVVLAPDYFTPMGLTQENFDIAVFNQSQIDPVREHLAQGLVALKSSPLVDPKRIGVVGYSLGGCLGLYLAGRDDVKRIVSYFGAYPPRESVPGWKYPFSDVIAQVKAPVLMFHRDKDELVPITSANQARDLLASAGKQVEYIVYTGAQHNFTTPTSLAADLQAKADSEKIMLEFFKVKM